MTSAASINEPDSATPGAASILKQPAVLLLGLLSSAFAFCFAVEKIYNYDIWWHLRTGQWILDHGAVPRTDTLSFATFGASWLPHYWLSDVLFALVHRLAGLDGLILFKALVIASAFLLVFAFLVRAGVSPVIAAGVVLLAVVAARFRFLLRPHVFMFPLAGVFFVTLSSWRRESWRPLWLLAPMLLWVNLHGSFFLAVVIAGCLLLELLAQAGYAKITRRAPSLRPIAVIGVLCAALCVATLATPFGTDLLRWVVKTFTATALTRSLQIEEYKPLVWGAYPLFSGLTAAAAVSFLLAWRGMRLFHLLVFAVMTALAIRGVRFAALAAMFDAAIIGINLLAFYQRLPPRLWRPSRRLQLFFGAPLLTLAAGLLFLSQFREAKTYQFGLGVNERRFPVAAIDFLRRLAPPGNVYSSWEIGGYLLWRMPDKKSFIDGRNLDEQVKLLEQLASAAPIFIDALMTKHAVRAAVVGIKDRRFAGFFRQSPRYDLVYFDDQALVFVDPLALSGPARARHRPFKLVLADRYDYRYLAKYVGTPLAKEAESELRRAVAISPGSFRARFFLAFFLETSGRHGEALSSYLEAAKISPALAFVHYSLEQRCAWLAAKTRRYAEVVPPLRKALEIKPNSQTRFLLASILHKAGRADEAKRLYQQILASDANQVSTLVNLGFLCLDQKRFDEAQRHHQRAVELAPQRADALYGLALSLQRGGHVARAKRRWLEFLTKHPTSRWASTAKRFLGRHPAP